MSRPTDVAIIYKQVIDDVIRQVRSDFVNMGVDEQIWEQKLLASKVFHPSDFPHSHFALGPGGHHHGHMGQHPFQMQMPHQMILPPPSPHHPYPTGMEAMAIAATSPYGMAGIMPAGIINQPLRQPLYPGVVYNSRPSQETVLDGRPVGGDSKAPPPGIPQVDGTDDTGNDADREIAEMLAKRQVDFSVDLQVKSPLGSNAGDTERSPSVDSSSKATTDDDPSASKPPAAEELGSDLDDESEDDVEQGGADIDDIVLCLYEKVQRTRNRWRCSFKAGIAHIGNNDFAFNKANGDFEW